MWCPSLTSTCCFLISPPLKSVLLNKPLLSVDQLEAPPCLLFLASFKVLTNGRWLDAEGKADQKSASDERRAWTCSNSQKHSRIKRNSSGQRKQNKPVWKSSPTTSTHSITFTLGNMNDKEFSFTACWIELLTLFTISAKHVFPKKNLKFLHHWDETFAFVFRAQCK